VLLCPCDPYLLRRVWLVDALGEFLVVRLSDRACSTFWIVAGGSEPGVTSSPLPSGCTPSPAPPAPPPPGPSLTDSGTGSRSLASNCEDTRLRYRHVASPPSRCSPSARPASSSHGPHHRLVVVSSPDFLALRRNYARQPGTISTGRESHVAGIRRWRRGPDDPVGNAEFDARFRRLRVHEHIGSLRSLLQAAAVIPRPRPHVGSRCWPASAMV
jgi:hypothetical protein